MYLYVPYQVPTYRNLGPLVFLRELTYRDWASPSSKHAINHIERASKPKRSTTYEALKASRRRHACNDVSSL